MKKQRFKITITLFDEELFGQPAHFIETRADVPKEMTPSGEGKVYTYRQQVRFPYFISHHEALLEIAKYKIDDLIKKDYRFYRETTQ